MGHIRLGSTKMRALIIDGYFDPRYAGGILTDEVQDDGLTLSISAPILLSLQIMCLWFGKRALHLHQALSLVEVKLDIYDYDLQRSHRRCQTRILPVVNFHIIFSYEEIVSVLLARWVQRLVITKIRGMTPFLDLGCQTLVLHALVDEQRYSVDSHQIKCIRRRSRLIVDLMNADPRQHL